ncbi:hypothetical protein ACA910_015650 [Epithemia clementina (nom. ined.)]
MTLAQPLMLVMLSWLVLVANGQCRRQEQQVPSSGNDEHGNLSLPTFPMVPPQSWSEEREEDSMDDYYDNDYYYHDGGDHDEELNYDDQARDNWSFVMDGFLEPGQVQPLMWEQNGSPVDPHVYQVGLPPSLRTELLAFCQRMGLIEMFQQLLLWDQPLMVDSQIFHAFGPSPNDNHDQRVEQQLEQPPPLQQQQQQQQQQQWVIQRPGSHYHSNVHWIWPGEAASHQSFLQVLSAGGLDVVLDGIGNALGLDGLVCYQLSFFAVSQSDPDEDVYEHYDVTNTNGKAFDMLIPILLVDNYSGPDLYILTDDEHGDVTTTGYQYRYDTAILLGDDVVHATANINYQTASATAGNGGVMRIMASVYLADINPDNVESIAQEFSQQYYHDPTATATASTAADFLLEQRGAHWDKNGNRRLTLSGTPLPPSILTNDGDGYYKEERGSYNTQPTTTRRSMDDTTTSDDDYEEEYSEPYTPSWNLAVDSLEPGEVKPLTWEED